MAPLTSMMNTRPSSTLVPTVAATATLPPLAATLWMPVAPSEARSTLVSSTGADGSVMSKMSIWFVAPLVTKRRSVSGSNAAISEPALPDPLLARPTKTSSIPPTAETVGTEAGATTGTRLATPATDMTSGKNAEVRMVADHTHLSRPHPVDPVMAGWSLGEQLV